MALNDIILNAVLNTADIAKKLKSLEGKGLQMQLLDKATNTQLRSAQSQLNGISNTLNTAKTSKLFGDQPAIAKSIIGLQQLNAQYALGVNNINKQIQAQEKLKRAALSGLSDKYRRIYDTQGGGITGAASASVTAAKYKSNADRDATLQRLNMSEAELASLRRMQNEYTTLGNKIKTTMKSAAASTNPVVNALNNLGMTGNTVGGIFGKLVGKVVSWMAAMTVLYAGLALLRMFITETKALQDAQMRLQRVMPTTSDSISGMNDELKIATGQAVLFADKMNKLAGASYADTINGLADVVKVGFNLSDAMMITEAALLAVNVAEMSVADATRFMTSTIRQFNMEAYDSAMIIDQWNALSQKMGASTENIAEAVTRSGMAMRMVGMTFAQVNAMAAATIEATGQTGESIGTTMKATAARYADINRRNSVRDVLKPLGIEIYDKATGTFQNFSTTLGQLAPKWGTLNEAQQANIVKVMAGMHHYTKFAAMIQTYDNQIKGVAISIGSQNSALNENARRTQSLDFQLRQLTGSFSKLTQSGAAQVVLKVMTATISTLGKALSGVGTIITGVVIIAIAAMTKSLWLARDAALAFVATPFGAFITTLGAVAAAVIFVVGAIDAYKRNSYEAAVNTQSFTASLQSNRQELEDNLTAFVDTYKRLGATAEASKEIVKTIEAIGGKKLLGEFFAAVDGGAPAFDVLKKHVQDLASAITVLNESMAEYLKLKKGNWTTQMWDATMGTGTTPEMAAAAKAKIQKEFPSLFDDSPITEGTYRRYDENITNQLNEIKRLKEAGALSYDYNTTIDENVAAIKSKLTIFNKIVAPLAATTKFVQKFVFRDKATDDSIIPSTKTYGLNQQLTDLIGGTNDKTLPAQAGLRQVVLEIAQVLLRQKDIKKGDLSDDERVQTEKALYDQLLGLYTDYYQQLYDKQKAYYDYIKSQNDALVKSFSSTLFGDQLKDGGFDGKNVAAAFTAAGGTVIDSAITQLNDALIDGFTGQAPINLADRIEFAHKYGADALQAAIIAGLDIGKGTLITALSNEIDRLIPLGAKMRFNDALYDGSVLPPMPEPLAGATGLMGTGTWSDTYGTSLGVGAMTLGNRANKTYGVASMVNDMFTSNMSGIQAGNPAADKTFAIWWDDFTKNNKIVGAGMGYMTGMGMNQRMGKEGVMGPLGGLIGSMFGGPGAVIGSMLGSWLDPKAKEDKVVKDEQVKNARESTRQLKIVNRNLTKMIEQMPAYSFSDSYYFSVSRSRGLS